MSLGSRHAPCDFLETRGSLVTPTSLQGRWLNSFLTITYLLSWLAVSFKFLLELLGLVRPCFCF